MGSVAVTSCFIYGKDHWHQ